MNGRRSAVMALFLTATQLASLSAERADQARPPANLRVESAFRLVVEQMWEASPTFRRQCGRLAAEPSLVVTVSREDPSVGASLANAWTTLTLKNNVLLKAEVHIKVTSNAAELIGHELEHILERLDNVDFHAQAGNGAVWKNGKASFETRRANEAGRRVAREIMDGTTR